MKHCNVESCKNNEDGLCQAEEINLRTIDSEEFDDNIVVEVSPLASVQVTKGILICKTYSEKEHLPSIRKPLPLYVIVCPKCGSENAHETNLHECPSGTPMRCSDCYHTWCSGG